MRTGGTSVAIIVLSAILAPATAVSDTIEDAKTAVLAKLKDPESARFSALRTKQDEHGEWVCGFVNAKNSYGGYVGNKEFRFLAGRGVAIIGGGGEISTDPLDAIAARNAEICKP